MPRWNNWGGMGLLGLGDANAGAPASSVVQSQQEFMQPYQQKVKDTEHNLWAASNAPAAPTTADLQGGALWQALSGLSGQGYSQEGISNLIQNVGSVMFEGNRDPGQVATTNFYVPNWQDISKMNDSGLSQDRTNAIGSAGMDYQGAKKALDDAQSTWTGNQDRVKTAYQNQLGGNYYGGFMNENSSTPFYGNTSAASAGGFGSLAPQLGQSTANGMQANGQATGFGTLNSLGQPGSNPNQLHAGFAGGWGGPFAIR